MSSEVMRLAFGQEMFPSVAVQAISPSPRVHRAAHYMAAMGLWRPPGGPGAPGPVPVSSCNNCMKCVECFPNLNAWAFVSRKRVMCIKHFVPMDCIYV